MIFRNEPQTWKDLQDYVRKIFDDCGYIAESPKVMKTARSEKLEVDVFVEIQGIPKQMIICECKYWDKNIPQAVVHAFRAQINDLGASMGLLISKQGFQTGALEAARFSNVKLLTWTEFEQIYEVMWYKKYFIPHLYKISDPLIEYAEPINSRIFRKADALSENERMQFKELRQKYSSGAIFIAMACGSVTLSNQLHKNIADIVLKLPLRTNKLMDEVNCFPDSVLDCSSYEELLTELSIYVNVGIKAFDNLFGERA